MKRKVIKQGNGTLTITLPKEWTKKVNLGSGDYIDIEDRDRGLLITREGRKEEPKKISVDISDNIISLERTLHCLYVKGYDEIEIISSDPSLLKGIEKSLNNLIIGFEIVKQSRNSCIIKSVADVQESEFENILRRTLFLLKSQAEGMAEAIEGGFITSIPNLRHMEQANNRYTGFLRRVLNKKGHGNVKNEKFLYSVASFLEKTSDEYKYLCDFFLRSDRNIKNIPKNIIDLFKKTAEFLDITCKLYYKYDASQMARLFKDRKKIIGECLGILDNSERRNCVLAHYIMNITQNATSILTPIMAINH